jgi:hypothetical protein
MAMADLDRCTTITYVMNKMAPGILGSDRSAADFTAGYAALGGQPNPGPDRVVRSTVASGSQAP